MTPIAIPSNSPAASFLPGQAPESGSRAGWRHVMAQLAALLESRHVHPARAVVLLPYAQLMQEARTAWSDYAASASASFACFVPRFETTMNWASSLAPGQGADLPAADDLQLDAGLDILTAASLLERAGLARQRTFLAGRLVEAAWSLARLAASQPPDRRLAWGGACAAALGAGQEAPALALELAVARMALAWAAASSYASDGLFSKASSEAVDLLVVLEGFQTEPLADALRQHFGPRAVSLALPVPERAGVLSLHPAQDAEDEAQRAAACVITHLVQGRCPVALIAQDRVLTRRIRAMLAGQGVALRDETGWKLSTTRAAATLMGLLRALPWNASTDAVLDWLKNAPGFEASAVTAFEIELRKAGLRFWRELPSAGHPSDFPADHLSVAPLPAIQSMDYRVRPFRDGLQRARRLADWLRDVRVALQTAGQWDALVADTAGAAVLDTLRLPDGAASAFDNHPAAAVRMSLQDFTSWVNQSLEAASFSPAHPPQAQVVILPLSQLLGRAMQAVVLPGGDEIRLAVSPEPPGMWTPAQRAWLGLPPRSALAAAQRTAWNYALHMPHLDVLWRTSEAGERLMPSGFVQEVLLARSGSGTDRLAADPRTRRAVPLGPTLRPLPTGEALGVTRLSASAYSDLRDCPYRFFALRQLKLQQAEELESELGKRDFGNWLHLLLHRFHEALKVAPATDLKGRLAMINVASEEAAMALGLSHSEFLPFAAIWPRVRDGYLDWLATHEASGAQFVEGEVWQHMPLGDITLIGKIDRIDQLPDGRRTVIDYKTEARSTTQARINAAQEDTQLAFYAALLADDTLAAAYVNLGEKEPTRTYDQPDIVDLRDDLIAGIRTDMARIVAGVALPALGEGKACDYCAARGLCRKDFWSE